MILNVHTVTALFLAGVGAVLALVAAVLAVRAVRVTGSGVRGGAVPIEESEGRLHLLGLVLLVLFLLRLLAWPHFYLTLASYVEDLAVYGVMCAFGVTRIQPGLVRALEWGKPLLLAGFAFWWLIARVDASSEKQVLARPRALLALPLALFAGIESALELRYLFAEKIGRTVTCCSSFVDAETSALRSNSVIANVAGSPLSEPMLSGLFVGLNAGLLLAALLLGRRVQSVASRGLHLGLFAVLAVGGVLNLIVTYETWLTLVAPRVLELPYHHCVYELLTDTPALGLGAALAVAGNLGVVLPVGLELFAKRAAAGVAEQQRRTLRLASIALASSLLVVFVHVV